MSYLKCYFFVPCTRKFDSVRSVLTRIRRVFHRSGREKLMRTRVAQIRRKTDYLRGALSRLMAHPRKRCFLWRRESITRPLTARSNFTRRNESEKRSLIFIAAIMDFITRFEERKKRSRGKEKREKERQENRFGWKVYWYTVCISSKCWYCFCNISKSIIYRLVKDYCFSLYYV